jgi:hypothetical protein
MFGFFAAIASPLLLESADSGTDAGGHQVAKHAIEWPPHENLYRILPDPRNLGGHRAARAIDRKTR